MDFVADVEDKLPFGSHLLNNRFQLVKKIGSGSFGEIYLAFDVVCKDQFAVKLEKQNNPQPRIKNELQVYQSLRRCPGYPKIRWEGQQYGFNVLVMELLGPSLEQLFNLCSRRFSMKTVLMLAEQMLRIVMCLHRKEFIHRDIKPDNFLMGLKGGEKEKQLHLVDFGLCKKYWGSDFHIPYREGKSFTGTARFASINAHLGIEQSRRDDLEAVGYVLVYFIKGSLPWQGLKAATKKQKCEKICEKKMSTSVEELCKGLPQEFHVYFNYCRELLFKDRPNYEYLRRLYRDLFCLFNYKFDYIYDWTLLKHEVNELTTANSFSDQGATSANDMFLSKLWLHLSEL